MTLILLRRVHKCRLAGQFVGPLGTCMHVAWSVHPSNNGLICWSLGHFVGYFVGNTIIGQALLQSRLSCSYLRHVLRQSFHSYSRNVFGA